MAKGKRFRSIWSSVIQEVLAPAGFILARGMYVRAVGGMLHGFQFQRAQRGREYTINLGLHLRACRR